MLYSVQIGDMLIFRKTFHKTFTFLEPAIEFYYIN